MFGRKKDKESKDAKDEKKKKGGSQTDAAVSGQTFKRVLCLCWAGLSPSRVSNWK